MERMSERTFEYLLDTAQEIDDVWTMLDIDPVLRTIEGIRNDIYFDCKNISDTFNIVDNAQIMLNLIRAE